MRKINTLVIHHSASPSGSVEEFRKEHKAKGWVDIGYHTVIGNGNGMLDGKAEQGRPDAKIGAAVFGNNSGKLFVCLVGNFEIAEPTRAQLETLGEWLFHRRRMYGVTSIKTHRECAISGHGTSCPGHNLQKKMMDITTWFFVYYLAYEQGRPYPTLDAYLETKKG